MNCIHLGTLFSQVLNDNECNNNSLIILMMKCSLISEKLSAFNPKLVLK